MIILLDIDGCIADFVGHLHSKSGIRSQVKEWDLRKSLTPNELEWANHHGSLPGFCTEIPWYFDAKLFLYSLMELGEVYAVTAPWHSKTWDHERRVWLSCYLPAWRVISCAGKAKHLIRGDVLIEDHPGTAAAWLRAHPDGYAILMDRPWNTPETDTYQDAGFGEEERRLLRAHSYSEALGQMEGIEFALSLRDQ